MSNNRWGVPQKNRCTKQWEAERQNPGSGYQYDSHVLTNEYLQGLWSTDPIFNITSSRTFNANYRNWAVRYRDNLERSVVRRRPAVQFANNNGKFKLFVMTNLSSPKFINI